MFCGNQSFTVLLHVQRSLIKMSVDPHLETTADHVDQESDHAVDHACGGEDASDDAAEPDQKLPQRHVLLSDFDH